MYQKAHLYYLELTHIKTLLHAIKRLDLEFQSEKYLWRYLPPVVS